MGYDIAQDPYVDPKTGILKNKLGATTQVQLNRAEAEITYLVIATLTKGTKLKNLTFDANLLLEIHKEIFRDIYKWAGKIRTDDISKDWAYFCHAAFIHQELVKFSTEIQHDYLLVSGSKDEFTFRITHYYDVLNAIHPFREGNGRAIRTYLRLLALKHNYDIEWARLDPEENITVSKQALRGIITPMQSMISSLIVQIKE